MEAKAQLVHPSYQGVCGRAGMAWKMNVATHGDLVVSGTIALIRDKWLSKVGVIVAVAVIR